MVGKYVVGMVGENKVAGGMQEVAGMVGENKVAGGTQEVAGMVGENKVAAGTEEVTGVAGLVAGVEGVLNSACTACSMATPSRSGSNRGRLLMLPVNWLAWPEVTAAGADRAAVPGGRATKDPNRLAHSPFHPGYWGVIEKRIGHGTPALDVAIDANTCPGDVVEHIEHIVDGTFVKLAVASASIYP